MNNPFLFFSDLDRSLFQSLRADARGTVPMTVDQHGNPHGHARPDQKNLFDWMRQSGVIIPVTARSHVQMERVTGWETGLDYDLALTDLGATLLLRDNRGDAQWHAVEQWHEEYLDEISKRTPALIRDFQMLKETLIPEAGLDGIVQLDLIALGKLRLPLYFTLSIHAEEGSEAEFTKLVMERFAKPIAKMTGLYNLHESDNIICLWPNFVSKGSAVKRLLDIATTGIGNERMDRALDYLSLTGKTLVTVGDCMTDVEFMQHGNFMMTPQNSEIAAFARNEAQRNMKGDL